MTIRTIFKAVSLLIFFVPTAHAVTAGFDSLALAPDSYFDPDMNDTFTSEGVTFIHSAPFGPCCWGGFTYSNRTDVTTPGFTNDTSAYHLPGGGGAMGTTNFAVGFASSDAARLEFDGAATVSNAYFTNNTYAALSMRDGDAFAKKFGGASGLDEDFFKLNIIGRDAADNETGVVEFYLADYRPAGTMDDYIVDTWTNVDLSSLGVVSALEFTLESTDFDGFGILTPAYFAMDELTFAPVPIPAAAWLLAPALLLLRRQH